MSVVLVILACVAIVVVLGTYGLLHHGDDFGFNGSGGGSGGGDIVPAATWLL